MATKNVEICMNVGNDSYDTLYPKIDLTNNQGSLLPVNRGGTGTNSWSNIANNLSSYFKFIELKTYTGTGTNSSVVVNFSGVTNKQLIAVYWSPSGGVGYNTGTDENSSQGSYWTSAFPQLLIDSNFHLYDSPNIYYLTKYVGRNGINISYSSLVTFGTNSITIAGGSTSSRGKITNDNGETYYFLGFFA